MGIPRIVTTDQGSEFKNGLNDEMMKLLNIKHHLTTAYHPQVGNEVILESYIIMVHAVANVIYCTPCTYTIIANCL